MSDNKETKQAPAVEARTRDEQAAFDSWWASQVPSSFDYTSALAGFKAALAKTEINKLIEERDAAIMSTHRQAFCIQQCAAHIGPETSATIDGLPPAVKRVVQERDEARAAFARASEAAAGEPDISSLVNRFLGWKLPQDFAPDAGISFKPPANPDWWPTGTNLFHAEQARQMFEYVCAAPQPASEQQDEPLRRAVKAVVAMLKNGEYAEHWADAEAPGDADVADLEAAITELVNETHEASEQQAAREVSDDEFLQNAAERLSDMGYSKQADVIRAILAAKGDGHAD